jgi:hypothetical protein
MSGTFSVFISGGATTDYIFGCVCRVKKKKDLRGPCVSYRIFD